MIIIDSDNYIEHGIESMFFPGGEPHIKLPDLKEDALLFLKLRTWNDVGLALCLLDSIRTWWPKTKPLVFIPYYPGLRQDKLCPGTPLTARLMGELFAGHRVRTFDGHSERGMELADIWENFHLDDLDIEPMDDVAGIIAPDTGAVRRAKMFRKKFYPKAVLVECSKMRDPNTGALSGYQMPPLKTTGRYIVVDDICDGGGTFNLLAQSFKNDPLGEHCPLELIISHGIFSKGLNAIDPKYMHITTTDSFCKLKSNARLDVIGLKHLFPRITGY